MGVVHAQCCSSDMVEVMLNAKFLPTGTFPVCPKFDLMAESLDFVANAGILMARRSDLCPCSQIADKVFWFDPQLLTF